MLERNLAEIKMLKIDLKDDANVLPVKSVNIGFSAKKVLKSFCNTQSPDAHKLLLSHHYQKVRESCKGKDVPSSILLLGLYRQSQ